MIQPYEERKLFAQIAKGDVNAYHKIFEFYYSKLRLNAFKLLKSEFWAEEIAQEVFLDLWDNRDGLSAIENPAGWLYRLVSNKCFDRIRRQELEIRTQYIIRHTAVAQDSANEENKYDLERLQRLIRDAVEQLPTQQREVYTLRCHNELSYKEIGTRLKISPHTVHNHLSRASKAIRQFLQTRGDITLLALINFFLFFFGFR